MKQTTAKTTTQPSILMDLLQEELPNKGPERGNTFLFY